jgi:hypothetical protein
VCQKNLGFVMSNLPTKTQVCLILDLLKKKIKLDQDDVAFLNMQKVENQEGYIQAKHKNG